MKKPILLLSLLASSLWGQSADPRISQANIHDTICTAGYTKLVRPPLAYTSAVKRRMMREAHIKGPMSAWELDHVIPLEVGGAPYDVRNLRLQPWPEARRKDLDENRARRNVCSGRITLKEAQKQMAEWKGSE